jgi:ubiquinone/menaquinone biosynthesis C-methylase UbiE
MKHKFKVINKSKLDSPKRREALPIQKILAEIEVKKSVNIADIGCGIGYFTFPFAEAVGPDGLVYAIDIELEMLEDIKSKMSENDIKNVIPINSQENNLILENSTVDMAFLCTVMHEVKMREKFLNEVNRLLVTGGEIVIIDWAKVESDYGPSVDHRLEASIIKRNLQRTGFDQIMIIQFNEYFYIIRATKK